MRMNRSLFSGFGGLLVVAQIAGGALVAVGCYDDADNGSAAGTTSVSRALRFLLIRAAPLPRSARRP